MPARHKEKTDFKTLEVSNLYYRYEDAEDDILKNISCVFEKGKKYAVVGKNGSGKTTFIRILSQIYPNYTGTIKLNDLDFSNYDFSSFGYYTSVDSFLLNGSLKDNITILDSYSLNVENEIPKLGVSHLKDSIIDPSCTNVSSGEKSKISILRALNTKKELLIFDEIFANVDEESEQLLTQYLLSLDKTIILITHNLDDETLSKFDGIIQL
jgi:ATP-binding cassette subfamily C protein